MDEEDMQKPANAFRAIRWMKKLGNMGPSILFRTVGNNLL